VAAHRPRADLARDGESADTSSDTVVDGCQAPRPERMLRPDPSGGPTAAVRRTSVAVWKLVHILSMFGAFGSTLLPMFLVGYLAARGDVAGVAGVLRARARLNQVAGPLFLLGLVSGGAMVAIVGWSATSPWLVASYVLILAYGAWDGAVTRPWERAVERALALVDKSEEVIPLALLRSRRPLVGAWGGMLGVVAIEAAMVLKPSFGL
jgi:hypothetical protein